MTDWNTTSPTPDDNSPYPGRQSSSEASASTPVNHEGTVSNPTDPGRVVPDNPVLGDHPSQRILARQIPSSASRGTQTMTGQNIINDPATNSPVITASGPDQSQTFTDPTTKTPRIIEGLLPNGTYGMWVSKPGVDVNTVTSGDQLVFDSNQDVFRIIARADVPAQTFTTATCAGSQVLVDVHNFLINHPFDFAPALIGYIQDGSGNNYILPRTVYSINADNLRYIELTTQIYSTSSHLVIEVDTFINCLGSPSGLNATVTLNPVTIFILQQSASF